MSGGGRWCAAGGLVAFVVEDNMDKVSRMLVRNSCQTAEIEQQRTVAIEGDNLSLGQSQSQTECQGRGESEVLQMIITRVRSQGLPLVTYGTEIRYHQFFAEVRYNRLQTIVSFHRATSTLVCLGRWP